MYQRVFACTSIDSISPVTFHQLLQLKIKAHQKLSSQACKPIALDRSKGSKSNLCLASYKQNVTTKVKFSCFLFFTWLVPLKSWYASLSRLSLPTSGSYWGLCTKVWFYMLKWIQIWWNVKQCAAHHICAYVYNIVQLIQYLYKNEAFARDSVHWITLNPVL